MAVSTPNWEPLQRTIAGEIALPGSAPYERGYRAFNARYHHRRPQAIVQCATPEDVRDTISFLDHHNLEHVARSGGHCFGGRSSTRGVVVDVTPMHAVSVSAGTAQVSAGARLGEVYDALEVHGLTIPGGTCPAVGIAGLALGGGLGILGRTYGVTSDRLTAVQIVLADGRIVDCDDHQDSDLFWSLRGAGAGNFGVVTSLSIETVPAPTATNFHLAWPYAAAGAVIGAWQAWAPSAPDELAVSLKLSASGEIDQPPSVDVYGALTGTESGATELVDELVGRVGSDPTAASSHSMSHAATRQFWAQLGDVDRAEQRPEPQPQPRLFQRSEFFGRHLPPDAVAALVAAFSAGRTPRESRELDFMPWGGAYNRVPANATAFVHRHERFLLKHANVVDPEASAAESAAAQRWVDQSWATVNPYGSGRVFQNFADPDTAGGASAHFGTNLQRLMQVKARYDPANFFRDGQSLPVQ